MPITLGTVATNSLAAGPTWTGSAFRTTIPVTIAAGQMLSVLVLGGAYEADAVAFNGTPLVRRDSNPDGYLAVYDLDTPDVGTFNLTLDDSSGSSWGIVAIPLAGVDGTTPRRAVPYNGETYGTTKLATYTTVAGDLVLDAVQVGVGELPGTSSTTLFAETGNNGSANRGLGVAAAIASGTATPIEWEIETAQFIAQIGVVYIPADEEPAGPSLAMDEQPTATQSGYLIDPAPAVHVLDAEGALNTSFTGDVTVSLIGSGGVLLGTLTVAAVAGVATFANLRPCEAGSYQLRFSAASYANLDSAVFAVTAGEGSTTVIVHQEAPMRPIRRNEPTAEQRDIPIEILADDGSPWDGDPDDGGGLKAQLSVNFGTETPSPANIVKLSAGNFRVRPTDAYCDVTEGSIIKARVPAAAGRREGKGWAHIIPNDSYVSAAAARKALVDAIVIASDGGNGYEVVKQPESNQIQRTIPEVGIITITATFSPAVPGIVSAGGS